MLVTCSGLWCCTSSASVGILLLSYLLSELQVALQSGHLGREGDKYRLPLGRQPPDMVVGSGSVSILVQCKLQDLVKDE